MHAEARLTEADVKMICDWASGEEDRLDQVSEMQTGTNDQEKVDDDTPGKKK